jgi:hypothetical protein
MKSKLITLLVLVGMMMTSCAVKSLHPFYKEDNLYFDPNLIGTWIESNKDSTRWHVNQIYFSYGEGEGKKEFRSNGYAVGHEDRKKKECEETKITTYDVFLFKLNNQIYADFCLPLFPEIHLDNLRIHNLAKVMIHNDEITFTFFSGDWLAELIETNKIRIAHEFIQYPKPMSMKYKGEYVLTASTDELQKFLIKYGNDPKAFVNKPINLDEGTYQWMSGTGLSKNKLHFNNNIISTTLRMKKLHDQ